MKALYLIPVFILLLGDLHNNLSIRKTIHTPCVADTLRGTILVINSFDAMSIKARNNKKDLFRELTDSLTGYLYKEIKNQTDYKPVVIPDILFKTNDLDSNIFLLMKEYNADKTILIRSLEVRFEESGSREETGDDGKTRTTTSYDLCARNEYTLYDNGKIQKPSTTENCEPFTTRSVKGRFGISFGPDIVGKRKHTFKVVAYNANRYILDILPLLKEH